MADQPARAQKDKGDKKHSNMPLFVVIGIVLVLNLLMVGKIFMGGGGGTKGAAGKAQHAEEVGPKVPLEEFLVNLAGSSDHYLKATITLGLKKDLTEDKIKDDIAPIRDVIINVLSSKPAEEIATIDGKEKLKVELKDKINAGLGSEKI